MNGRQTPLCAARTAAPAAAVLSAVAPAVGSAAAGTTGLDSLLDRLPADEYEAGRQICRELMKDGPAGLQRLFSMVTEPGYESGVKPRYAVHALAVYAARPGAAKERKMVAAALADHLGADLSVEVKSFFVRQLQWAGTESEIPALAKLLGDDQLCEPASQALCAIRGDRAAEAFRKALPKSRAARRVTIIKGLGFLRDRNSVKPLLRAAGGKESDVRLVAFYALGNIGDPRAADVLLNAAKTETGYERTQAVDACVRLATRLAEKGQSREAAGVLGKLEASFGETAPVHVRCAVLDGLAGAFGAGAVERVISALDSKELRYRAAAANTAVRLAEQLKTDRKKDATTLLEKTLEVTDDEALIRKAQLLLKELA